MSTIHAQLVVMMSGLTPASEVYHAVSSPAPGLLRELRTIRRDSMDDRSAASFIGGIETMDGLRVGQPSHNIHVTSAVS